MTEQLDKHTQDLERELRALREEVAQLRAAAERGTSTKDFAEELQAELRKTLNQTRERGQAALDKARARGDQLIDTLERKIEAYPLLSLCLMFFAGILLARLLERRDD